MSTDVGTLVTDESSLLSRVALTGGALGLCSILVGIPTLVQVVPITRLVAGVALADFIGALLFGCGLLLLGIGIVARAGYLDTQPDTTAGLTGAIIFALIGFVGGGLIASQTFGFSTLWPLGALVGGIGFGALSLFPREDIGATFPPGILALFMGVIVLTDVIGPGWSWSSIGLAATFPADIVIPVFALVGGLFVSWTAARAESGFGADGKQASAYLLVTMNAVLMVGLLVALVGFVVMKGFEPMTQGLRFGLFTEPFFWFYFPPIDEYVIISIPGVWIYWPFVMEGVSFANPIDGVLPAIVGTVWLVIGAVSFAVPLGVGAAVYLTEYAPQGRFTQLVEISTNGLWSTPSIVFGLFGLAFLVPRLGNTKSLLAGQIVLGFMLLPLVLITSREALLAVPDEYRDASAALGVGKWETIKSVVLPAAMPGVITGIILGVGRIAGETAPLLLVTTGTPFPAKASSVLSSFELSLSPPFVTNPALLEPASALPYQLFAVVAAGVGKRAAFGWGTALVLLLVVLGFYAVGIASRIYFRKKLDT
jgi:phosphate transport system permease protein